jgi:hypothetical protein
MSLDKKFEDEFIQAIEANQEPCWRCGIFHATKVCSTNLVKCYKRGPVHRKLLTTPNGNLVPNHDFLLRVAGTVWQGKAKPKKSSGESTVIPDHKIGSLIYSRNETKHEKRPDVPESGASNIDTEHVGPMPKAHESLVVSNYVRVTSVPKDLFVHSVSFWMRTIRWCTTSDGIKLAFESLVAQDFLELGNLIELGLPTSRTSGHMSRFLGIPTMGTER